MVREMLLESVLQAAQASIASTASRFGKAGDIGTEGTAFIKRKAPKG